MKCLLLVAILFAAKSANAIQSCTMDWDGKRYTPTTFEDGEISAEMTLKDETNYRFMDQTGTIHNESATLTFKMLKAVPLERNEGVCKLQGIRVYDRIITAIYFEASADKPVFGNPTDGAAFVKIKAWGLCKGLLPRDCK